MRQLNKNKKILNRQEDFLDDILICLIKNGVRMKKKIFFAYESGHHENIEAIKKGASDYNNHQKTYYVETWEDLKVGGVVINSCIFDAISKCEIFACDLTYQNHNVLFELGYAIAKEKRLLIFLNESIKGAKESYNDFKILKNVGYDKFTSSKQVHSALQTKIHVDTVLLEQLVNVDEIEIDTHDIFMINSKVENQASLDLVEYIKSSLHKTTMNNTSEVEYQSLIWYIKNIFKSKQIILHMTGNDKINSGKYNAEFSFFAGLGFGLGKKVLLIAPSPFDAPIDYTDILLEYKDSDECLSKVKTWIFKNQKEKKETISNDLQISNDKEEKKLNLLRLGIGYEIAEDEENTLLNYYIASDFYNSAFNRQSTIIVGRKGSGKSALFIKLLDDYKESNDVINVVIKPDSDELLDNVELTKLFNSERSKKSFLLTVWKFVIISKLIIACNDKILKSSKVVYTVQEGQVIDFCKKNKEILNLNFYGVIRHINNLLEGANIIDNPDVLNPIYHNFLNPMIETTQDYIQSKKYLKVHLLADNLDKAWDSRNDLLLQADMILSLLEFPNKMKSIFGAKTPNLKTVILLRKDIYDYIIKNSREPDKLTVKTNFISWSKYPDKLKELLEERFMFSLGLKSKKETNDIWSEYFSLSRNKEPFNEILKVIVPRPRDIIYFVSKLFESAVNSNLHYVDENCFTYAIEEYSNFLHNNLLAEMKAEFPEIEKIMNIIQTEYFGKFLLLEEFISIITDYLDNFNIAIELIESLFEKQYIVGYNSRNGDFYSNYITMQEKYNEKRFIIFRKNKIHVLLHPRRHVLNSIRGSFV